jgi:hypothetical protein
MDKMSTTRGNNGGSYMSRNNSDCMIASSIFDD